MEISQERIQKFWEWCGWERFMKRIPQNTSSGKKCAVYVCDAPPRACEHCGDEVPPKVKFKEEERWYSPFRDTIYENIYGKKQSYMAFQLPPIDLNNLFKYAVPKLKDGEDTIMLMHPIKSTKTYCQILDDDGETVGDSSPYEDPATALFLALEKVMNAL